MKTRIIQTRFYDDEFVVDTDLYTQHLYIYLLTCSSINICGIFQLPIPRICFESKLTVEQVKTSLDWLSKNNKVHYYKGWVFVVNAMKNNNYVKSLDNALAFNREVSQVPPEVLQYFNTTADTTVTLLSGLPSTVSRNKKPEIRNKKPETINQKSESEELTSEQRQKYLDKLKSQLISMNIVKGGLDD